MAGRNRPRFAMVSDVRQAYDFINVSLLEFFGPFLLKICQKPICIGNSSVPNCFKECFFELGASLSLFCDESLVGYYD